MKKHFFYLLIFAVAYIISCIGSSVSAQKEVVLDTKYQKLLFTTGEFVLTGSDGAISIEMDKKKSLWLWGDAYMGKSVGDGIRDRLHPNVFGNLFSVLDGDKVKTIYGGTPQRPGPVVASEKVEGKHAVYWPHHGLFKNGIFHMFATRIVFGGTGGMWDFRGDALVYYRVSYPDFKLIDIQFLDSYAANEVGFGYGLHKVGDHYCMYGSKAGKFFACRARLVNDKFRDWEFFDGTNWTTDPAKTKAMAGTDGVWSSSQFSVFKHKNKFILINQGGMLSPDIYSFISDSPTGPWYNKKLLYKVPEIVNDKNLVTYNAMAHPQYKDKKDMLLVSYCLNMSKPTLTASDYQPRFIWVPYDMILK